MIDWTDAWLDFGRSVALLLLTVVAHIWVDKLPGPKPRRDALLGFLYGSAGVLGMLSPIIVIPGIIFDLRAAAIGLAAFLVGPGGGVVCAAMLVLTRLMIGGAGAWIGIVAILVPLAIGVGMHWHLTQRKRDPTHPDMVMLGLLVGASSFVLLMLLLPDSARRPAILAVQSVAIMLGTVAVGTVLLVQRRNDALRLALAAEVERLAITTEALMTAKQAAEAANQAKAAFLASMSHELRTPLNAIIGFADMIERETYGALGDRRYREYAGDIRHSGEHLLDLVNSILDMVRIDAGRMEVRDDWLDLECELRQAARMAAGSRPDSGVEINLDPVAADLRVRVDCRSFRQILLNLLSNALKFTPSGGKVDISVSLPGDGLALTISDTGIGIPQDKLALVGRPFYQLDNVLTRTHEGTGIGLYITRSLVELHGGSLSIDSRPDQGTSVTVHLPASRVGTGTGTNPR